MVQRYRQGRVVVTLAIMVTFGVSHSASAGIRSPHAYSGTVIFDRWDGCYLVSGTYLMYIPDTVKEKVRHLRGESVRLDATKVQQWPENPGDGFLHEVEFVGYAEPGDDAEVVAALDLEAEAEQVSARGSRFVLRLSNRTRMDVELRMDDLSLTVFGLPNPACPFNPPGMPSVPVLTRHSFGAGGEKVRFTGGGVICKRRILWTLEEPADLPREVSLPAGASREFRVLLEMPPGPYQLLFGYGGGVHAHKGLVSNLVSFDVKAVRGKR
jgi:hypothetical protein